MRGQTTSVTAFGDEGVEGLLLALSPLPVLVATAGAGLAPESWRLVAAGAAGGAAVLSALLFPRAAGAARVLGVAALAATLAAGLPAWTSAPSTALAVIVLAIGAGVHIVDHRSSTGGSAPARRRRRLERARSGLAATAAVAAVHALLAHDAHGLATAALGLSALIDAALLGHWGWSSRRGDSAAAGRLALAGAALTPILVAATTRHAHADLVIAGAAGLLWCGLSAGTKGWTASWAGWGEPLLNHPARVLTTTFLGLCAVGALLLALPWSTTAGRIAPLDAVFTAVSAACVTGLIVLDTPADLTRFGQAVVLLLIQLGGLGIMSVSAAALQALGRRISLRQEFLLRGVSGSETRDLARSLGAVVWFTLAAEGLGALLLAPWFLAAGDPFPQACWRAVFTSVSAFCNAGFALQSDSLVPYARSPWVLHSIGMLIVIGGIAPATSLAVPRLVRGRSVAVSVQVVVAASLALLGAGAVLLLALEWDGALRHLAWPDKLHNAWFQSVTLRTAGFNSVPLTDAAPPSRLVMMAFMFIGGSPGGTAGGVKTTTVAVLALAMWATLTGTRDVHIRDRALGPALINRAIAVVGAGALLWFITVLALAVTQSVPFRDLAFEATSALGTVGLSTGATGQLDGIGKIIVALAMFAGRVGPLTVLTLLGDEPRTDRLHRIETSIPLT